MFQCTWTQLQRYLHTLSYSQPLLYTLHVCRLIYIGNNSSLLHDAATYMVLLCRPNSSQTFRFQRCLHNFLTYHSLTKIDKQRLQKVLLCNPLANTYMNVCNMGGIYAGCGVWQWLLCVYAYSKGSYIFINRCLRLSGDEVKVNRRRALHSSLARLFIA